MSENGRMSAERDAVKKRKITAILLMCSVLAGCGTGQVQTGGQGAGDVYGMESAPVLDYEVPSILPGVLINQIGYETWSQKMAVVRGSELPKTFRLVDAVTGEVVYTGNLEEQGYDNASGEYISHGDFTEFAQEGSFYVECDIVGRSYPFEISDTLFDEQMNESLALMELQRESFTEESIVECCRALSRLLLSYELYGQVYDSQESNVSQPGIVKVMKSYVDWLLTWQDADTGAVMVEEKVRLQETAWLSATLAKFSYSYQKTDSVYATACLQAADRAWKHIERSDEVLDELHFYAAAELYRATGTYRYHTTVREIGALLPERADNEAQAFGTLTYTSTKRRVEMSLCKELLDMLLNEAETIAERAKANYFSIGCTLKEESLEEIIWDSVVVSATDYVITNSEYAALLESYQSFLGGCNEQAHCFVYGEETESGEDETREESVESNCVNTSGYIMLLSEIMSHEQED